MTSVKLYHGTPMSQFEEIKEDGFLFGPVYLTPCKKAAEDYAANNSPDFVVIEVEVDYSLLNADSEFVSEYCVDSSLEAGSVYVEGNVSIENAEVYFYEDYSEV